MDFKYEKGGNTGLFLRVGDLKDHVASGFELQMFDTGHKERPGNHDTGGIIGATAPFSQQAKPGDEWQRYQVILNGSYIVVFLNGELVQACDLSKSPLWNRPMAGYISLQDEAREVSFKSIRIKELK